MPLTADQRPGPSVSVTQEEGTLSSQHGEQITLSALLLNPPWGSGLPGPKEPSPGSAHLACQAHYG